MLLRFCFHFAQKVKKEIIASRILFIHAKTAIVESDVVLKMCSTNKKPRMLTNSLNCIFAEK
jgi:hypothetical protein